jgi:hypothetical protein
MGVDFVNLIDHRLSGAPVIRFKDDDAFWNYTSAGRQFPLAEAKMYSFIKILLMKLWGRNSWYP